MERLFNVADFQFSIKADDDGIWKLLGNYAPFETHAPGQLLFEIEIANALPRGTLEPFYTDNCKEPDMPRIDVLKHTGGYLFVMKPSQSARGEYRFWTDGQFHKAILESWDLHNVGRFPLDNTAMIMFAMASARQGTLAMHASVTVCHERAYLFLGKSGTGKSTHSRLWMENIKGCHLLNDDNPVVRFRSGGDLMVYGTPWSGKTPCYRNESCRVGALVNLAQYPENRIHRMTVLESLAAMYMSCSGMRKLRSVADGMDSSIDRVIETVPLFHLDCLPDRQAAVLCHNTVSGLT